MLTYALRALRWQYLLAGLGPTRFSVAFRATVIGFAASFLLPARAGEFLRPYLLAKNEKLQRHRRRSRRSSSSACSTWRRCWCCSRSSC